MPTSNRKKREFLNREDLILDTARGLFLEVGYFELNMDRIAEATEYSKGTIYQHFSCKEEILVALLLQSTLKVESLLQRAATFPGRARERVIAMAEAYELFARLYPYHFKTVSFVQNDVVAAKASAELRQRLEAAQQRSMGIVSGVVRDGVAQGDLVMPPSFSAEELAFGLWAAAFGAYVMIATQVPLGSLGIRNPRYALQCHMQALLDGLGWQPLFKDWDYEHTRQRIRKEIFPQEWRQAGEK